MLKIGITGNMGCGKSTVAQLLAKEPGVLHFDTDSLAKGIIFDPQNMEQVLDTLGEEVVVDGVLDHKKIAACIFRDKERKQQLEAFVHPRLWGEIDQVLAEAPWVRIALIESAIIFERSLEEMFDGIVTVYCDEVVQYQRLMDKRGFSKLEAARRLQHQLPQQVKRDRSDVAIDSNCSLDLLREKVLAVYVYLTSGEFRIRKGKEDA